jgi:hypothetical protein
MYWIKTLNNLQSPRVPVNEHVVGSIGALIGAPTCRVKLIEITQENVGWEFRPGRLLELGIANGSESFSGAAEVNSLSYPLRDANPRRYVGVFALHDLCWGGDSQWLELTDSDMQLFSHDHGHYFPGGPDWTVDQLVAGAGTPHEGAWGTAGLNAAEATTMAARIAAITDDELAAIMRSLPAGWPVTDEQLACLAWFVSERRAGVADRLKARFASP